MRRQSSFRRSDYYTYPPLGPYVAEGSLEAASRLREATSKTSRPACPYLSVGLEALYNHIPLGFVPPEITEDLFLIWRVLTDPLQATLDHK